MDVKESVLRQFPLAGEIAGMEPLRGGHINRSWLVSTDAGEQYVLQWVNRFVFPQIDAIMENLRLLRDHLKDRREPLPMISFIDTREGRCWLEDSEGGAWRLYRYVGNSVALLRPRHAGDMYQCALGYGRFLHALRDFPAERLSETIPRFHDTPDRYRQLREAMAADPHGRLAEVGEEIRFALSREERACRLHRSRESGEVPLRVTHNDTKCSNVLLRADTGAAVCVIDLDTVMPGLSAYDYGDAIRSGASTRGEDRPDCRLDLSYFEAFTRGFLSACPELTAREKELLPLGAYTMTVECGVRFLTDYLNGDRYFSIAHPKQNLDRARAMFSLAADMEERRKNMEDILQKLT